MNRKRQKGNRKGYSVILGEGERERRSKAEQSKSTCTHETALKLIYNIKEWGMRFVFKQIKKLKKGEAKALVMIQSTCNDTTTDNPLH